MTFAFIVIYFKVNNRVHRRKDKYILRITMHLQEFSGFNLVKGSRAWDGFFDQPTLHRKMIYSIILVFLYYIVEIKWEYADLHFHQCLATTLFRKRRTGNYAHLERTIYNFSFLLIFERSVSRYGYFFVGLKSVLSVCALVVLNFLASLLQRKSYMKF